MQTGVVIALSCVGGVVLLCIIGLAVFVYLRRNFLLRQKSVGIECDSVNTNLEGITGVGLSGDVTPRINENEQVSSNEENSNNSKTLKITRSTSHYDYPKSPILFSSSQRPASFPESYETNNIYENIQPRRSVTSTPNDSFTPNSDTTLKLESVATTSLLSYKDVVFSVTNETPTPQTTVQPKNIVVPRSVSPPISPANRNTKTRTQRYANRNLQHRPGFKFPYKTLVIATDATPRNIGGYVINHFSKRVEFYSVPASRMPWILRNTTRSGNPTEFEMKNLLCALLIWEEKIVRHRKVAIFTDNSAIIGNSLYGSRVRSFIHHLESCKQVLHVNPQWTFLNSKESPEVFNEFIVPADHLSRLNEPEFRAHIISYHYDFHEGEISQSNFNAIRQKIMYWTRNTCRGCGFHIPRAGSLKKSMMH